MKTKSLVCAPTSLETTLMKPEFLDIEEVLRFGAKKHSPDGWLDPVGHGTSHKEMHASMSRHLAYSSAGLRYDSESGLEHLLHLACRALMLYTRHKRGIVNPEDKV